VIEATRGIAVFAVVYAAAPLVGQFFAEPDAVPIVRAIGLAAPILGLKNPGIIYFQKELDYHKEFVYQTGGSIVQFLVTVGYVLVVPSVWSFVYGYLAGNLARFLFSYLLHGYRPSLSFDAGAAREMFTFGKWVTGSSIVYFLYSQGDDAFVGAFLGAAPLALYQYAYRFSNAPATELSQVVGKVMFPAYSQMQDDITRIRSAFLQAFRFTAFVAVPMAFGLAIIAPSFVRTFLGTEWVGMIPAMQALAVYGLGRALTKNFSPVWKALGRPDIPAKMGLFYLVFLAVTIYPATAAFGVTGAAVAVSGVYALLVMPVDIYLASEFVECRMATIYGELFYPLTAGLLMAAVTWWVQATLPAGPPVTFVVTLLTGAVSYVAATALVEVVLGWGIRQEITTIIDGIDA
jgi:PST family polysaccharide transporter/lipopolysaccharide exporter